MKIQRLETHDRLLHLKKEQSLNIAQGAEDCLKKNSLSLAYQAYSPYIYLFAHPRTLGHDEKTALWMTGQFKDWGEIPEKVMFWQPRLSKPEAQTNSYLFRALSNTDELEVCWLIPPQEMWPQYKKGNVTEHQIVNWSITMFQTNKKGLETPHSDDLNDQQAKNVLMIVAREKDEEIRMKKLYTKPDSLGVSPSS